MDSTISLNCCVSLLINKGKSHLQWNFNGSSTGPSIPSSTFLGHGFKKLNSKGTIPKISSNNFKIVAEVDEKKQTDKDRWRGLAFDESDDQQDITRGKGMVDSLFQAPMNAGTHNAVMSSYDYLSVGLRQ